MPKARVEQETEREDVRLQIEGLRPTQDDGEFILMGVKVLDVPPDVFNHLSDAGYHHADVEEAMTVLMNGTLARVLAKRIKIL